MITPITLAANALLVCLAMTVSSRAGDTSWTRKTAMPTARFWFTACAVDGKIYAIGGARSVTEKYLPTVEEYDPATDTWTQKTDMPTARDGHAASVVSGKIYVIGGEPREQASIPTVEAYDPATDTWTQKANMPTRRTFAVTEARSLLRSLTNDPALSSKALRELVGDAVRHRTGVAARHRRCTW